MRSVEKYILPYRSEIITGLIALALGVACAMFLVTFQNLPQIEKLQDYKPKGITVLLDKNNQKAHEYFQERRIVLSNTEIPDLTKKAFLAAEDWQFYDHMGIDIQGIFRAMITNLLRRSFSQGASTITQQLSRNLFLSHKKTIQRKLKEVLLTLRIERKFTKEEILTLYLNQIYLGEGTYGIEQAALLYFGKNVRDLNIAENALLASLPKNPNIYSPFKNPEKCIDRRNLILSWMRDRGVITQAQMLQAKEESIPSEKFSQHSKQNYFTYFAQEELQTRVDPNLSKEGHLTITSGYDANLQKTSEEATQKGLLAYMSRHKLTEADPLPQIASISIDVHTGEIRAIVGGTNIEKSLYNRAFYALRQPGSSIKPFLYALAFDQGFSQSTFVLDAPITFSHAKFGTWSPENYEDEYHGFIPIRRALETSKNTAAVRTLQEIGVGNFIAWLKQLGFTTQIEPDLTIALGSSSVYLVELAKAYATFANGGHLVQPSLLQKITNDKGDLLYNFEHVSKKAIDERTAFLITDAMMGVISSGTGQFAKNIPCQLAGKTGTTNQYIDSVFAGYSSELVTVVWVGFDDNHSLGHGESGARAAGQIWKDIMQAHCESDQPGPFLSPQGIVWETVDHETGLLPNKYSVNLIKQAYKQGTQPTEDCCVPEYNETMN